MTTSQLLATHLKHQLGMLKWHLDDFSDADMFVRPCPGANHAMWQTGHIVASTGQLLAMVSDTFRTPIAEGLTSRFTGETARLDDPSAFPTLAELRQAVDTLADAAGSWAAELPQSLLEQPSPDPVKAWAPTRGLLLAGIASHVQMHVGQIQVIRRKLGKPHLF
ncbi:MAG: DinB family protein [Phycisphaerae bacterium]|nr:DinB family protein [Phycisphaerae bacterium]MDW8262881.1 DinB family protein [Phycisphaerales bacterium]